jgi:hypothetical protein
MTHEDEILLFLCKHRHEYCDDCLSVLCTITPRQQVNQVCNKSPYMTTRTAICHNCGGNKIVRSL